MITVGRDVASEEKGPADSCRQCRYFPDAYVRCPHVRFPTRVYGRAPYPSSRRLRTVSAHLLLERASVGRYVTVPQLLLHCSSLPLRNRAKTSRHRFKSKTTRRSIIRSSCAYELSVVPLTRTAAAVHVTRRRPGVDRTAYTRAFGCRFRIQRRRRFVISQGRR